MEVLILFGILVFWPWFKGCFLYLADREEWRRQREREHEVRMENKRMATGIFGLFRRFLGG